MDPPAAGPHAGVALHQVDQLDDGVCDRGDGKKVQVVAIVFLFFKKPAIDIVHSDYTFCARTLTPSV